MEIPYQELKTETLESLIESFILREGSDYGDGEFSLQDKVDHIHAQLKGGKAVIVYDLEMESCSIIVK